MACTVCDAALAEYRKVHDAHPRHNLEASHG